jgi:hypothetical protein
MAREDEERQRERDREETHRPGDDAPDVAEGDSDAVLWEKLEDHDYPASADELVEAYGDYEVEPTDDSKRLHDVLSAASGERYQSADEVQARVEELLQG